MENIWKQFSINAVHTDKIFGVLSRNEFLKVNKLIDKKDIVAISILQPGVEPFEIEVWGEFKSFRTFSFNDTTVADSDYSTELPIPFDMAKDIRDFIMKNKDSTFLIHCMAGQSRSAGVAKAIECLTMFDGDVYGYKTCFSSEIDKHKRYTPNLTVFDRVVTGEDHS